jgi:hypothetical protein
MAVQHACQINARPKSRGEQKYPCKFPLDQEHVHRQDGRYEPVFKQRKAIPLKLLGQVIVTEINCHSIFDCAKRTTDHLGNFDAVGVAGGGIE